MRCTRPLLLALTAFAAVSQVAADPGQAPQPKIAVFSFAGADSDYGASLADTLTTGLGRYDTLGVIETADVQEAAGQLKFPDHGPLNAQQVQKLGRKIGAAYLVVGSYIDKDERFALEARVYNVQTGAAIAGGAEKVAGGREFLVAHEQCLAHRLLQRVAGTAPDPKAYSGLVIEADGVSVQRSMAPRILDESGRVLYPVSTRQVPPIDFLQSYGMACYVQDETTAPRSGDRPLIVRASGVAGSPKGVDLVVSNETAEQILQADKSSGFLESWAVSIVVRPPDAGPRSTIRFKNGDTLTGSILSHKEGIYLLRTELGQIRVREELIERVEAKEAEAKALVEQFEAKDEAKG